jgi:malate dehydrogenase (oxaloacetate-decarboxylating)(NADP+)
VRARRINEEMKLAAAHALAALAREDVPDAVSLAYGGEHFSFGPDYVVPKPFDPRVLLWVAPAVAQAAMETKVARITVDIPAYKQGLLKRQSRSHQVMSAVFSKARGKKKRIVFNDGDHPRVLQAARILRDEDLCVPVLLGFKEEIDKAIVDHKLEDELKGIEIVEPRNHPDREKYAELYWKLRQRRGITHQRALEKMKRRGYFASMMVETGVADGMVTGLTQAYPEAIRPPLETIRTRTGRRAGGVYVVAQKNDFKFFADCTVNPEPTPEALAEIAIATADLAKSFDVVPRVAFLSYSNWGDAGGDSPARVRRAVELARFARPELELDGEMQVDAALIGDERRARYPFSTLTGDANVLVFPSLDAANIAYKLLWRFGGGEVIGPVLLGMNKPVSVLQQNAGVQDIVNLAAVAAVQAIG